MHTALSSSWKSQSPEETDMTDTNVTTIIAEGHNTVRGRSAAPQG